MDARQQQAATSERRTHQCGSWTATMVYTTIVFSSKTLVLFPSMLQTAVRTHCPHVTAEFDKFRLRSYFLAAYCRFRDFSRDFVSISSLIHIQTWSQMLRCAGSVRLSSKVNDRGWREDVRRTSRSDEISASLARFPARSHLDSGTTLLSSHFDQHRERTTLETSSRITRSSSYYH
jgi:hypothetical protein